MAAEPLRFFSRQLTNTLSYLCFALLSMVGMPDLAYPDLARPELNQPELLPSTILYPKTPTYYSYNNYAPVGGGKTSDGRVLVSLDLVLLSATGNLRTRWDRNQSNYQIAAV